MQPAVRSWGETSLHEERLRAAGCVSPACSPARDGTGAGSGSPLGGEHAPGAVFIPGINLNSN